MDSRSGGRPPQVRPRPASSGRAAPVRVRPVRPSPTRLARYRTIERRRALPLPVKAAMAASVALLSIAILWIASGAVGPAVEGAVRGVGSFVGSITTVVSSPEPTAAPAIADAPTIEPPTQAYTNDELVDVTVNVPANIVGAEGYTVRLWVTLKDQEPRILTEVPVGPTSVLLIPDVELAKGRNTIEASILGPGGEGERSEPVAWVLDQSRPKITISSPKDNSRSSKDTVTVKGKTQVGSTIRVKNDLTGNTETGQAGKDGLFSVRIAIEAGINTLTITAIDLAGNPNTETISVRKGSGTLQVSLSGSAYRFSAKKLPASVAFQVVVTGPDGRRIPGAVALFTVTVPGLEAIVSNELLTNRNGVAAFETRIPRGALPGSGLASVLVTSDSYGQLTDRQVLTVR
ncbi:MAG TPA: Ig-like domain-containing protein [Candidatus Limnocylindrales bacterium]|nr:Ig-like domain-containing protein [Candidatus Limnocylindrales bacterium]